jgi:peroxiredoxin/YHS domain-containing protein
MRRIAQALLGVVLLVGPAAGEALAAPQKAVCLVCKVTGGETEEEEVKAVRTWQGKEYGFCSEKCAATFAADPAAYVPSDSPWDAPSFRVNDLNGKPITSADLKGKVVLLDFWATWCAPCRKSMPELQALHEKYSDRGFTVLGVSIDEGGPAKVKKLVRAKKFTYPIAMDSKQSPAWEAFRVKAVPAAFLIDQNGQVVAQWTGAPASGKDVEAKLETLLRAD